MRGYEANEAVASGARIDSYSRQIYDCMACRLQQSTGVARRGTLRSEARDDDAFISQRRLETSGCADEIGSTVRQKSQVYIYSIDTRNWH